MFENREIDGWFVKSERPQGKKHRNTCCIPRIFDAAAAAFCRKRRLFRFFKQPLTCILTISPAYLVMITTVSEKRDINGVSATSHIPSTFLRTTTLPTSLRSPKSIPMSRLITTPIWATKAMTEVMPIWIPRWSAGGGHMTAGRLNLMAAGLSAPAISNAGV